MPSAYSPAPNLQRNADASLDSPIRSRKTLMRAPQTFVLGLLVALLIAPLSLVERVNAHGLAGTGTPGGAPSGPESRACNSEGCCKKNNPGANGTAVNKPVWSYDGSENMTFVDMTVGVNFPIEIVRRYDSRSEYDSAVGYGWSHLKRIRG